MKPLNYNKKQSKLLVTLCFVCFFAVNTFAQETDNELVTQVNISMLHPGISIETPLSERFTIFGKIGLGLGLVATDFPDGEYSFGYAIRPVYNVQGRYYYNGSKSVTRSGKPLFSNSGNYIFAQVAGRLSPIASSSSDLLQVNNAGHNFGLGWGFQRTYKNNFLISWGIGLGCSSTGNINAIGELTLGITLNKK